MNGAITEPWAAMSRAPRITMTMMIGASHSFLRTRRKAHSSLIKFMRFSELILERVAGRSRGYTVDPVRAGIGLLQAQFVAAKQTGH